MSRIQRKEPTSKLTVKGYSIDPIVHRILENRGVNSIEEMDIRLSNLQPPDKIQDINKAARLIVESLRAQDSIVIVGDYDADGATSTALLFSVLKDLCAYLDVDLSLVDYIIPNRFDFGYGLSPQIVDAIEDKAPDILITVDNGITSIDGAYYAYEKGMRVVITDHHLPGEKLPCAEAIVDPQRKDDESGLTNLAGVGVVFYLTMAIEQYLLDEDENIHQYLDATEYLDLVAIGTISDLVKLDFNNRILAEQGMRRIRNRLTRIGVEELFRVCDVDPLIALSTDISFKLAPRLNAAGRMDQMSIGVNALLAEDQQKAKRFAKELNDLNVQRRQVESTMTEQALKEIEQRADTDELGVCVTDHDWHQGVTGIVASRLKERFDCPSIAFAPTQSGELAGSARSIPGLHFRDLLVKIDKKYPNLIKKFGGHAMAAGVTIEKENFDTFRDRFIEQLKNEYGDALPYQNLLTDGSLPARLRTIDTVFRIHAIGVMGVGFEPPVFDDRFYIRSFRVLKGGHLRFDLIDVEMPECEFEAIAFSGEQKGWDRSDTHAQIAYSLDINRFKGDLKLQLKIEYMEFD